jgi:AraC-like DNA-binding protein
LLHALKVNSGYVEDSLAQCSVPVGARAVDRLHATAKHKQALFEAAGTTGPESTRVRRILVEHLGQSVLTLDAVAAALAVSRRTLTRRLAEERASFRHIFDEVRSDFARALLQDRSLSIGDIAFFLQYSEPAAFHRSFRRWTGLTPHAFREA